MVRGGYSPNSIKNYLSHINKCLNYTKNKVDYTAINAYVFYLMDEKDRSHTYVNQAISAMKLYLKINLGEESIDGIIYINRPKTEKKLPKVMSKEEVKLLLHVTKNIKHKTMLMLGYSAGLRVSEVASMRIEDIDSSRILPRV